MIDLQPFQKRFIRGATRPGIDTAALSLPRGNGKSWLAGYLVARILDPDDVLFRHGTESVLAGTSIEQCRIVYRFARDTLEPRGGYRFLDSFTRVGITHVETNTRLRVVGSNGKTAMGLVNCPWVVADEPGAWEVNGGTLMHDAIETAKGKPGSPLRVVYIGTLAPATGGWWHDLVQGGSQGSTYVQALQGDSEKWDSWHTIRRCNPLVSISAEFRKKLLQERDAARRDTRLKARFLSYRLNIPSGDESTMLLTVDDWQRVVGRPVPPRQGRPLVAYDLGGGRSWSAAVGIWKSGRCEALAVAPGIPSLEEQEKRDRVGSGLYRKLAQSGRLRVAEGLRVQPPAQLHRAVLEAWGQPASIYCDRFRLPELQDVVNGLPVVPRVARWSEASEDIRGLRSIAADGPLACEESSRLLVAASLSVAMVKSDDQGSVRLVKTSTNNTSRDDVAAALALAAGAFARSLRRPVRRWRYRGMA
jgi:phage terminase large subunit-like protein